MLAATRWLFMAEIDNEADGGDSPATLGSALESLESGYNPDPADEVDMNPVEREILKLIKQHGEDKELEDLLTVSDWKARANSSLQEAARAGK